MRASQSQIRTLRWTAATSRRSTHAARLLPRIPRVAGSGCLSTDLLGLATTCHTLVLAFEVRGGSHDDHSHRSGHSLGRAALPGRPVVGHGPGRMDPRPAANARSWTSTPHPAAGRGAGQSPGLFDTRGGAQLAGHRTTGDWLATSTRTSAGHAGWWVHTARALRDVLPETAAALADGAITIDHVRAIRGAHRTIGDALTTCEDTVVAFARDPAPKTCAGSSTC